MELEKLSKPEDTIVRQYIKKKYGVKVAQFSLWNLTPTEAASKLQGGVRRQHHRNRGRSRRPQKVGSMWSWYPKPWMHVLDYAALFSGPLIIYNAPHDMRTSWVSFLFVGGVMVTGMTSYIISDVVMLLEKRKENIMDARIFAQPTEEEKRKGRSFIQNVLTETVVTQGNVRLPIRHPC